MSNKGRFTSYNQPKKGRGKSERTKWLEAMKKAGHSEDEFYELIIEQAMSGESPMAVNEILRRISPIPKAVAPSIEFDLDPSAKPHQKAEQILDAISNGKIPPDIGATLIASIKAFVDIEEYTVLKDRVEAIEKSLGIISE